jgi:hypothetical protein
MSLVDLITGGLGGAAAGTAIGGPGIGTVIGGGLGALGGYLGGKQAEDAADASKEAARLSAEAQLEAARIQDAQLREFYNRSMAGYAPTQVASNRAMSQLSQLYGLGALPTNAPWDTERAYLQQQIDALHGKYKAGPPEGIVVGLDQRTTDPRLSRFRNYMQEDSAVSNYSPEDQALLKQLQARMGSLPTETPFQGTPEQARTAALQGFQHDPGYEFRLAEGQKAVDRLAAARGRLGGAGVKDLMRFNQGIAADEYGNYINRLNSLAGLAPAVNQGQAALNMNAGSQLAGVQQGIADARTSAYQQAGAANSGLALARANQIGGLTNNLAAMDWSKIFRGTGGLGSIASQPMSAPGGSNQYSNYA